MINNVNKLIHKSSARVLLTGLLVAATSGVLMAANCICIHQDEKENVPGVGYVWVLGEPSCATLSYPVVGHGCYFDCDSIITLEIEGHPDVTLSVPDCANDDIDSCGTFVNCG